jgi:hypothetical protein
VTGIAGRMRTAVPVANVAPQEAAQARTEGGQR